MFFENKQAMDGYEETEQPQLLDRILSQASPFRYQRKGE